MRTVLIDTSSAILLYKGGLFQAMASAYRLTAAGAVPGELTREGYPGASVFAAALAAGRLARLDSTAIATPPALKKPGTRVHAGERDTLTALLDGRGEFVIMDDGAGAQFCRLHHIPYINALLCPRILHLAGRLGPQAAAVHTARLRDLGRYAPAILDFADTCEDAVLRPFLP